MECPRCDTKKPAKKRYENVGWLEEIFTCVDCGHEFKEYELRGAIKSRDWDRAAKHLEKEFSEGKITKQEFEEKLKLAME